MKKELSTTNFAYCYFAAPGEIKKEPEQLRRRTVFMIAFSPGETTTWMRVLCSG